MVKVVGDRSFGGGTILLKVEHMVKYECFWAQCEVDAF